MRDAFDRAFEAYDNHEMLREIREGLSIDWHRRAIEALRKAEGQWLRRALEAGPGWNVWRSHPYNPKGDIFVITHDFKLLAPGEKAPGAGIVFHQPNLSPGERVRLLAGRYDWQDDKWQDECGEDGCGHSCCIAYRDHRS